MPEDPSKRGGANSAGERIGNAVADHVREALKIAVQPVSPELLAAQQAWEAKFGRAVESSDNQRAMEALFQQWDKPKREVSNSASVEPPEAAGPANPDAETAAHTAGPAQANATEMKRKIQAWLEGGRIIRAFEDTFRPYVPTAGDLHGEDFFNHLWAHLRLDPLLQMKREEFDSLSLAELFDLLRAKGGFPKAGATESSTTQSSHANARTATDPSPEETKEDRAKRRRAVVMPILAGKHWKRGRLVTKAAVGKGSVYEYLDGTRKSITTENRKAIAESLGIKEETLPE